MVLLKKFHKQRYRTDWHCLPLLYAASLIRFTLPVLIEVKMNFFIIIAIFQHVIVKNETNLVNDQRG